MTLMASCILILRSVVVSRSASRQFSVETLRSSYIWHYIIEIQIVNNDVNRNHEFFNKIVSWFNVFIEFKEYLWIFKHFKYKLWSSCWSILSNPSSYNNFDDFDILLYFYVNVLTLIFSNAEVMVLINISKYQFWQYCRAIQWSLFNSIPKVWNIW